MVMSKDKDFNPRTREGCDNVSDFNYNVFQISIHAPAKGATCKLNLLEMIRLYFNPRTREGCDIPEKRLITQVQISIHAPAKGATLENIKTKHFH